MNYLEQDDWIKCWIKNSSYDIKQTAYELLKNTDTISVTTLIKPIRQLLFSLSNSFHKEEKEIPLTTILSSAYGNALHDSIESSVFKNIIEVLKEKGLPEHITNKIVINPDKHKEDNFNIYLEKRFERKFNNNIISGKIDLIYNGQLVDYKSTSVSTYLRNSNFSKYQLQGSIYRWIVPHIITEPYLNLQYLFTDWSKYNSIIRSDYPKQQIYLQKIPLLSLEDTELYIGNKLNDIQLFSNSNENDYPKCSDSDLWRDEDTYKVLVPSKSNPYKSKSIKNFNNYADAYKFSLSRSNSKVQKFAGKVKRCNYCNFTSVCSQYKEMKNNNIVD